jgi:hypothetical protein
MQGAKGQEDDYLGRGYLGRGHLTFGIIDNDYLGRGHLAFGIINGPRATTRPTPRTAKLERASSTMFRASVHRRPCGQVEKAEAFQGPRMITLARELDARAQEYAAKEGPLLPSPPAQLNRMLCVVIYSCGWAMSASARHSCCSNSQQSMSCSSDAAAREMAPRMQAVAVAESRAAIRL